MKEVEERIYRVHELALGLKRWVEDATVGVWVEGEVGRLQRPVSGHLYFTLKDEERDAVIDCVVYRREALRYGKLLHEGARVQLGGRATFYPPRGRLQWVADAVRPAGQGALLVALEKLKAKLLAEGLFALERKRPLPSDPKCVGVVTSRTGAVFADICTVAKRRAQVRIVLAPALVQGEGAVESLLGALDRIERLPELDVLIVGRGGGSQEDLAAFNDERIVRRLASFRVPVVSAVGHETDTSLSDLVADARAATPSQAAELVVPDDVARRQTLLRLERHLARVATGIIQKSSLDVARLSRRLGDPRVLLAERQQQLDDDFDRLRTSQAARLSVARRRVLELQGRLAARHPRAVLAAGRSELAPLAGRLHASWARKLDQSSHLLASNVRALHALSPLAILGRGYALALDESSRVIRDPSRLRDGESLTVRVEKGTFFARVEKLPTPVENKAGFEHESAEPSRLTQRAGEGLE